MACTSLLTYFYLGDRSMKSFDAFVFPDMPGAVIVHDRYRNYDNIPGVLHQLCTQHLLRDLEDAAQTYPGSVWPGQAAEALRALIHASNVARDQERPASQTLRQPLTCGSSGRQSSWGCRRSPVWNGANTKQKPGSPLRQADRAYRQAIADLTGQASLGIQTREAAKNPVT